MNIFKTFFKVAKEYKGTIILYTVILIAFSIITMQTNDNNANFSDEKPTITIVNHDNHPLTNNFVSYLKKQCTNINYQSEEARKDALFYRKIHSIIEIPKNYHLNNKELIIQSTNDYQAALVDLNIQRYLKVQQVYLNYDKTLAIKLINKTLKNDTPVTIINKTDLTKTTRASLFYNFISYSLMAGIIYVICLVIYSFKEEKIYKRTIISSMSSTKLNNSLFISSSIFALALWLIYVIFSFVLLGDIMFTSRGLIYILNSFIFTICCLTIALLISNLVHNKEAIGGIINVVALGSAFLSGVFVSTDFLPDIVLKIAHLLPSYWYVQTNEKLATLSIINIIEIKPLLINMLIIIIFSIIYVIINQIITNKSIKKE